MTGVVFLAGICGNYDKAFKKKNNNILCYSSLMTNFIN